MSLCCIEGCKAEKYPKSRYCLEHWNARRRERTVEEPGWQRPTSLARGYGITETVYRKLLEEQGGVCAICDEAETAAYKGRLKQLAVDHCHATNEIRGLLCARCNMLLAAARDRIDLLARATVYLEEARTGLQVGGLGHADANDLLDELAKQ